MAVTRSKGTGRTGRPLKIHTIVDHDEHGRPMTAGDKIIALTRAVWCPWEDAAATVGVDARTLRDWRRLGATARARIANHNPEDPNAEPITPNDRALADFVIRLERAEAEAHAAHLSVVHAASRGGMTETRTVTKIVKGVEVEKVVTTVVKPPIWQASAWMLERRRPDKYRTRHELTGKDGAPLSTAERADAIGGWLEGYLEGQADQVKAQLPTE